MPHFLSRPILYFLLCLICISFIAYILGESSFHPLNASNGTPVKDIALLFPWWDAILEPLAAPIHIFATLPDIRMGMMSIITWLCIASLSYGFYIVWKGHSVTSIFLLWGKLAFVGMLYLSFTLLIPLPNWALEKSNNTEIITDLHSHSLISHDGVISLYNNLSIHKKRGYDLVAITDHANLSQSIIQPQPMNIQAAEGLPGMEIPVYYGGHFYISVFGMDKQTHLPNGLAWYQGNKTPLPPQTLPKHLWSVQKLIQTIHKHGGVISIVALHLDAKEVKDLAHAGVDAFEIVNFGHHPLSKEVRQAMLQAQKEQGVALIASNDWHGWTGILNTWTIIQPNPTLHKASLKDQVIDTLKHHGKQVIPVTAYPMHTMNNAEIIFAPFIALYQYTKTISLPQLLSLWAYFFLFFILSKYWRWQRMSLSQATWHTLIIGMSSAIFWHSISLYHSWSISLLHPPLAYKVSLYGITLGAFVLLLESYRIKRQVCK